MIEVLEEQDLVRHGEAWVVKVPFVEGWAILQVVEMEEVEAEEVIKIGYCED